MIDFVKIKQIYKLSKEISFNDIQILLSAARMLTFKKGTFLIQEGSTMNDIMYIREGIVRSFYVNEKGEETTVALIDENRMIANVDLLLFNQPSRYTFEALEDVHVLAIKQDVLENLVNANSKLQANRIFVFQNIMRHWHNRIESFVLYTPEQRYSNYVKENPSLINRVPDKYIAHVLGITPVSLSRIRKRLSQKKSK